MNVMLEQRPQASSFCATWVPTSLNRRKKVSPEHCISGEAAEGHPLSVTAALPPHNLNEHNENLTVSVLVVVAE